MNTPARTRFCAALLIGIVTAWPALGQDRKSEQSIRHRRAAFTLLSTYFSRLLQTVEGDRPFEADRVRHDAQIVETLSRLPWEGFAPGTERGDTRAKEDIWLDEDQFRQLAATLQQKTAALSAAAASGDLGRLKAAFSSTRDICNACHKQFRLPIEETK
ncbi:MAG: hypothetical protein RLZZ401_670 [Pseudomonadota bacterium]|jgi:cytochrome c556